MDLPGAVVVEHQRQTATETGDMDSAVRRTLGKPQSLRTVDKHRRTRFRQIEAATVHLGQVHEELAADLSGAMRQRPEPSQKLGIGA